MFKISKLDKGMIFLVPLQGIKIAKSRLRQNWPNSSLDNLIWNLYEHTIDIVKSVCEFGVVSPSIEILNWGKMKGAEFEYQDLGLDLNQSLENAIIDLISLKKWNSVCVLMGDLPLLSKNVLINWISQQTSDISILPVYNAINLSGPGTSGLYIPFDTWTQITLKFGQDSFEKFQTLFKQKNIAFNIFNSIIGRDLDILDDFNYLHAFQKNSIFVKRLLAQLI